MKTIIVWHRNDLRVHDHPALATASVDAEHVVPVFMLDQAIWNGPRASGNRNRFLVECLTDVRASYKKMGGTLFMRAAGKDVAQALVKLAKDCSAKAVYCTADYSPYALERDKNVKAVLEKAGVTFRLFGGRLAVDSLDKLQTKSGTVHKVFTPFWKNWQQVQRRPLAKLPRKLAVPSALATGTLPTVAALTKKTDVSPDVPVGGETAGRKLLRAWLKDGVHGYAQQHNDMAADKTSHLSPYLHFGCVSVREIEELLPDGTGPNAFHRQLAWRDFYHYILYKFPANDGQEFQERYRGMAWSQGKKSLMAWQDGQTGYPVVDAAMRQLKREGWMHNRARLIVGSFLTKDLGLDWRLGEAHFMRWLLDGDMANNNGNWQWIASVGVDPAPVFRRLYNPARQQENYDPAGAYVRKYVPELKDVPDKFLAEPWTMDQDQQKAAKCIIGKDYPAPIVDHASARQAALERYRNA